MAFGYFVPFASLMMCICARVKSVCGDVFIQIGGYREDSGGELDLDLGESIDAYISVDNKISEVNEMKAVMSSDDDDDMLEDLSTVLRSETRSDLPAIAEPVLAKPTRTKPEKRGKSEGKVKRKKSPRPEASNKKQRKSKDEIDALFDLL